MEHYTKYHNRPIYYFCLLTLVFFSCQQSGSEILLSPTIESLMSTHTDNVWILLNSYIIHSRESLIRVATNYCDLMNDDLTMQVNPCYLQENIYLNQKGYSVTIWYFKNGHEAYIDPTMLTKRTAKTMTIEKDILFQQNKEKDRKKLSPYFHYQYIDVVIVAIFIIFFTYKRIKHHQKILLLKQEHNSLQQTTSTQFNQMKKDMVNKEQQIIELKQLCNKYQEEKQSLQQLNSYLNELLEEKRKLCTDMENATINKSKTIEQLVQQIQLSDEIRHNIHLAKQLENMKEEKHYLFDSVLSDHSIAYRNLLYLKQQNYENPDANKKLPDNDWKELLSEVDQLTHGSLKRLTGKYERLLKEDIYFCCLVKIGIKYSDMASILCCTPNAIYKKRNTILKRMNIETTTKFEFIIEEI